MVVIFLPTASLTGTPQERTATPSIWTVQAPHCAMPQPYLVPVRPMFSRIAQSSGVSGSTSTSIVLPLMVRLAIRLSHSGLFVPALEPQCWTQKRHSSNQDFTLVGGIICGGCLAIPKTRLTGIASQRLAPMRAIAVRGDFQSAMTSRHHSTFPRRGSRPGFAYPSAPEGAGNAGRPMRPRSRVQNA